MPFVKHERMPEAETSLRVAFHLLESRLAEKVEVAIDGAQIKTMDQVHFNIGAFLMDAHCAHVAPKDGWRGAYLHAPSGGYLNIHSKSGQGDVVATLKNDRKLRVEAKKGTLERSKSSQELPLLREALGQLLTIKEVGPLDLLAVAVPESPRFSRLAACWRDAPLVKRVGFQILTVSREHGVQGLDISHSVA